MKLSLSSIVVVFAGVFASSIAMAEGGTAADAVTNTVNQAVSGAVSGAVNAVVPTATTSTPATSTATTANNTDAAFQESKTEHVAIAQERVQMVQKYLACLQATTDQAGIKNCRDVAKKDGDVLEAKIKAQQELNKQERQAKKAAAH